MFKVLIRNREPLLIPENAGETLKQCWLGTPGFPPLQTRVEIAGVAIYSRDIVSIEKVDHEPAKGSENHNQQSEREYLEYRRKRLQLTLEERAEIMSIPNLVWSAHTQEVMSEEVVAEIKTRQLAYFKDNPNCMYANPKIYRDLIPPFRAEYANGDMQPQSNVLPTALLRLIENIIGNDLRDSLKIVF